ncbi:MAG TPA: hypothetical protein VGZ02_12765 [Candidatus Baltobacteraceae bacterium]|nr:hypothetical protein [Candidatus Baltobacteraceae bacterium]
MEEDNARNRRALKALINAGGFMAHRFGESGFVMPFSGRLRDWHIRANLCGGWLAMSTYVMELPDKGPTRSGLLERMLELNDVISVGKFSKHEQALHLDVEYRQEHVDASAFSGLVGLVHSVCEQYYPELVRIATGDTALQQLEVAFQRPALGAESKERRKAD